MMRQYELVERVTRYNPNADENLLNKAYVYAMQKHGTQTRANGDPYFSHPLEVAGILTDLKLDDATIAVALLHDTIEDTDATRAEIDQMFGEDIGAAGRGADQDQQARPGVEAGGAGGEPAQAAAGHLLRHPRAAGEARRPAAQHAHAAVHAGGGARAHRPGDARHLCAAGRPHGHARHARGDGGPGLPHPQSGGLCDHRAAPGGLPHAQPQR